MKIFHFFVSISSSFPSGAVSSSWSAGRQCARGGQRWAGLPGGGWETTSACPLVPGREGPVDAGWKDNGGDTRRTSEAEERQPRHDGDLPLPDGSLQWAQHQTQRGTGSSKRAVWVLRIRIILDLILCNSIKYMSHRIDALVTQGAQISTCATSCNLDLIQSAASAYYCCCVYSEHQTGIHETLMIHWQKGSSEHQQ